MAHVEPEPRNTVLGRILEDRSAKLGEKIYVYFKEEAITYEQVNKNSNRMANGYSNLGVKKGDKVSIMMPNCPEFLYHWFGLAKLGAVDNPINTAYKGDILKHLIMNSGSKALLVHEQFLDRIQFIIDTLEGLESIIIYPDKTEAKHLPIATYSFQEIFDTPSEFSSSTEISASDSLNIIYTGGTTGPSKGAILSHGCLYNYAKNLMRFIGLTKNTLTYNCLPIFHANHRLTSMATLLLGGSYAMGVKFSARSFWDEIRKYNANHFHFLGGMPQIIYAQQPRPDDADNPAVAAWGGPIPLDIAEDFEKRFDLKLYNGFYGLTEAVGVTWVVAEEADRLKKQGRWSQAVGMGREQEQIFQVRLVDDNDYEVQNGQIGEIVCRPTCPDSMFLGYVNNPEATLEVLRNLWFHTGDLARKDDDGFFHFVDRKKDYIRRRGENISSYEIEKVVNAHPAVVDSGAIAAKSELGEDEVRIVVMVRENKTLTPEELMAWCEPRMAYFMVPRFVDFVNEFPRNPVGRIEKYKLREQKFKNTWDREKAGYELKR